MLAYGGIVPLEMSVSETNIKEIEGSLKDMT